MTTTDNITAKEAAGRLGVSVRTFDRYVAKGLIEAKRTPGGQRRFASADVDKLLWEGPK